MGNPTAMTASAVSDVTGKRTECDIVSFGRRSANVCMYVGLSPFNNCHAQRERKGKKKGYRDWSLQSVIVQI